MNTYNNSVMCDSDKQSVAIFTFYIYSVVFVVYRIANVTENRLVNWNVTHISGDYDSVSIALG